ncbi:MAG: hypothetical protein JO321_08310 [Solirubrobacterales bacterium]|nr:hypothetical protein [Solirubrobacterales bacterium]MBV9168127.1 hypothetical protein [Solirubrobacterales bacterium]MBV9535396.1 hypothetical protein [Solirubrobacterales bacterium]
MYRFSRAMYRELAGEILEDVQRRGNHLNHERSYKNHEQVLRACEAAVERLATDRHYFARPALTLFKDIRDYFPLHAQARVLRVIERYLDYADEFLQNQPNNGYDVYGNPLRCRASTRKGTPCQRVPLPHNGYCPSHQHLAETEELEPALAA